jgi:hypothetical protein
MAQKNTHSNVKLFFLFICGFNIFLFILFLNSDIFFLNYDFIVFLDSFIFLFAYKFIMILCYCKSCEYDLCDLVFIHLIFLFFIYSSNFPISNISVFLQGRLYHPSTILIYVSIVVEFVTFNIMWSQINIYCLNIYFIGPAIYNFMSKVRTIKTMTIK